MPVLALGSVTLDLDYEAEDLALILRVVLS